MLLRDGVGAREAGGRGRRCRGASATPTRAASTGPTTTTRRWRACCRRSASCGPAERIALISDQWALVRADLAPIERFLDLVVSLRGEEDHVVLDEVVGRLALIEHRFLADEDRAALRRAGAPSSTARAPRSSAGRRPRARTTRRGCGGRCCCARWSLHRARPGRRRRGGEAAAAAGSGAGDVDPNLLDVVVTAAARRADDAALRRPARRARSQRPIRRASAATCTRWRASRTPALAGARRRAGAERRRPDAGLLVVRQRAAGQPRHARGGVRADPRPLDRDARQGRLADDPAAARRGAGRAARAPPLRRGARVPGGAPDRRRASRRSRRRSSGCRWTRRCATGSCRASAPGCARAGKGEATWPSTR